MDEATKLQGLLGALGESNEDREVARRQLRYALYVRKSTTGEDRQASSIEDQTRDCYEKIINPNELNVVSIYKESCSAKIADVRQEFRRLISDIESHRIDGLIAWHPDRLSRNMKEAGELIDLVDRGLIKDLRFPTFTFENTPAGKMLLGITFVMAKQYSEHLAESVDRGNKRAVEDGEFIGKFKHGYLVDPSRRLQPDPHGFTLVKRMFQMALEGKSQKEIRLWINKQSYQMQKRQGGEYMSHTWDKDDVSKLLRDPNYVGIHIWGKTKVVLTELYDFEPMITVEEFLKINRIDSLDSKKVLTIHSPKSGAIKANLLRGIVYCSECNKTLTSMMLPKKDKATKELIHYRYYYKCETEGCTMHNKSSRALVVIAEALKFFEGHLFITKSNYASYVENAKLEAKRRSLELDGLIAQLRIKIANKDKSYENAKELVLKNPDLKEHYKLDDYSEQIKKMKSDYDTAKKRREGIFSKIPTYEEYLKLFESAPVILGKIRDMNAMNILIRNFFSNFTIHPVKKGSFQGATVSYELKEPWKGFVENGDFVCGAGTGTLTRDLFLGKEAL